MSGGPLAGAIVCEGAVVPDRFECGEGCEIGPYAYVATGVRFEERVRVGARATLAPRGPGESGLLVRSGVEIGAGVVVAGASVIERGARIEPGAVVTGDVPPFAIVVGNPGRVIGYVAPPAADGVPTAGKIEGAPPDVGARKLDTGASLLRFPEVVDLRGHLSFGEVGAHLPFAPKRFFLVYGVPSRSIRGEHAHRTLEEVLIAVAGSLRVSLTDGRLRSDVVLDDPTVGLHLPTGLWSTQYDYSPDAVLLVLASEPYDPASYIREYDEFARSAL
jgi:carbonic anhydrase/acetyltransferase-like protein (isoleucine patch superfamily)